MTRRLLAALLLLAIPLAAQQPSPRDLFERARILEESNRNLDDAVALYEQAAAQSADRELAANALLRSGLLLERRGRPDEAQRAFQAVATRYPDFASLAREARSRIARIEPARQANGMSSRQVWTVPSAGVVYGGVSRDGRYLPYADWGRNDGDLVLYDIASGTSREIPNKRSGGFEFAQFGGAFSPDGTQLAYGWFNSEFFEIRIARVQAPDAPTPRVLFSNGEVPRVAPEDWSPDGTRLAVQLQRADKTAQIGLVAVQDGSLRVLKSIDWRLSSKLFFSPDGKYLAYDLPVAETSDRRDVFILAVDGSRDTPAVVHPSHDMVMGWSPDGSYLLFTSDRTGSAGLWALPVAEGKPQAEPRHIKADVSGSSLGVTGRGTLHTLVRHSNFTGAIRSDIHVAAFDFQKGEFAPTPRSVVQAFVGANNLPAWSPDGKQLAFISARSGTRVIMIRSEDSGALRELQPGLNVYGGGPGPRWSPDGLALAIQATDSKGRQGLFRMDVSSGESTPIVLSTRGPVGGGEAVIGPMWAPDGKRIYYSRLDSAARSGTIVERDLGSGDEKELYRSTAARTAADVLLSPDGRFLSASEGDWFAGSPSEPGTNRKWSIVLVPTGGAAPRELMRRESHGGGLLMWAPDGRSLFVCSIVDKSTWTREVWRVPIDGSQPQRLDLNVDFLGPLGASDQHLHVHPDGQRVAFAVSEPAKPAEVWALEDFLTP